MHRVAEVFVAFLKLGLTSFGGPVAHLGYFREAFVTRRQWLSEIEYGDLVALCQFLPGPASSQVGIAIGQMRAGIAGAIAAWVGFTLPSVVLLYAVALGANLWSGTIAQGLLHGMKLAALAVVAQAVWQMSLRLTPDWPRRQIALVAAAILVLFDWTALPVLVIAIAAFGGAVLAPTSPPAPSAVSRPHPAALAALIAFAVLLIALPLLALTGNPILALVDRFYRTGALVFGGGHVVLPLLEGELVTPGLIDRDLFLAGYGAAQAVPGPLFSFAFYSGVLLKTWPHGVFGGLLALGAIYLPAFLLVLGALPYWTHLKGIPRLRRGLDTANAATVGLLLAALYDPVFTSAVSRWPDIVVAVIALFALSRGVPPWIAVVACAIAGVALAMI